MNTKKITCSKMKSLRKKNSEDNFGFLQVLEVFSSLEIFFLLSASLQSCVTLILYLFFIKFMWFEIFMSFTYIIIICPVPMGLGSNIV